VPLSEDVDVSKLARSTSGFAGADLENLVNEAALLAARRNKEKVEMNDFELAKDKVLMGAERRSMVMSLEEKRKVAYHESGHALVAVLQTGADPLHKVTIIPRGMALGVTQQLPIDDRYTHSRGYLMTELAVLFGGRVAEQMVFNEMWTGAGNDIERATELARKMVCEWGMSEELGPMTFGKHEEQIFLGRDINHSKDYSEHTAQTIDREVRHLIEGAYQRAKGLLTDNTPLLHALADRLLEKEVVDGAEVVEMVAAFREGRPLNPEHSSAPASPPSAPLVTKEKPRVGTEEAPITGPLTPKPSLA
jgi:cell division protease FtsH